MRKRSNWMFWTTLSSLKLRIFFTFSISVSCLIVYLFKPNWTDFLSLLCMLSYFAVLGHQQLLSLTSNREKGSTVYQLLLMLINALAFGLNSSDFLLSLFYAESKPYYTWSKSNLTDQNNTINEAKREQNEPEKIFTNWIMFVKSGYFVYFLILINLIRLNLPSTGIDRINKGKLSSTFKRIRAISSGTTFVAFLLAGQIAFLVVFLQFFLIDELSTTGPRIEPQLFFIQALIFYVSDFVFLAAAIIKETYVFIYSVAQCGVSLIVWSTLPVATDFENILIVYWTRPSLKRPLCLLPLVVAYILAGQFEEYLLNFLLFVSASYLLYYFRTLRNNCEKKHIAYALLFILPAVLLLIEIIPNTEMVITAHLYFLELKSVLTLIIFYFLPDFPAVAGKAATINSNRISAINDNMADLTDSLKYCAEPFISYLEIKQVISMEDRQIATSELTAERQILVVLKMLQQKDAGWEYLIEFLNNDHRSRLANALQTAAGESVLSPNLQTHSEEETPFIISETRVDLEDSIRSRTNDPAPVEVILIRDGEESAEIHEPSSEANENLHFERRPLLTSLEYE